ncbi:GGDEF domain-containing protein [Gandjariella thermophila]|nr:GGDEF domain-containing protein [Gandjariella thermophila]
MTGLLDRWGWDTEAPRALALANRSGRTTALLLIDLDRFKDVNDRFGHHAGDQLLRSVADVLRRCTGDGDLVGRYGGHGGDEFLLLLPGTDLDAAVDVACRIRDGIRSLVVTASVDADTAVTIRHMTASVGVAVRHPGEDPDLAALVMGADAALRDAKRRGRDRVGTPAPTGPRDAAHQPRGEVTARHGVVAGSRRRRHPLTTRHAQPWPVAHRHAANHRTLPRRFPVAPRTLAFALAGLVAGLSAVLAIAMTANTDQAVDTASPVRGASSAPPAPTSTSPPATPAAQNSAVPAPTAQPHARLTPRPPRPRPPRPATTPPLAGPWLAACPFMTSAWLSAQAEALGCRN